MSFLTVYTAEIDLTFAASFYFLIFSIAIFVTKPYAGRRFDKLGENAVMIPAIAVFAIELLIFSQVHYSFTLLLSAVLEGTGFGAKQSLNCTELIGSNHPRGHLMLAQTEGSAVSGIA